MPDKAGSSPIDPNSDEKGTRREFLKKSARAAYVAPLVATFRVAEVYDAESGNARARGVTPPPVHHGEK